MRLTDLLKGIAVLALQDEQNHSVDICGLTSDSRQVKDGYLFAALPGSTKQGTDYISDAIDKGAVAILTSKNFSLDTDKALLIQSDNPRRDLAQMAARFYSQQPETLSAVTGTNGKTSVAWFTAQFYALQNKKSASLGTLGLISDDWSVEAAMTTPDPITLHKLLEDSVHHGIEALCLEASSHGLDQERLSGLTFGSAAFTNITRDHLDYHKTEEDYFTAKSKLFIERLMPGGRAIIYKQATHADALIASCQEQGADVITYGTGDVDFELVNQTPTPDGQIIQAKIHGKRYETNLPLIGDFQALNILCAMALSDIDPAIAFNHLPTIKPVPGRMEKVGQTSNNSTIYVDYAHTPDALGRILKTARLHTKNQLRVVFGCGGDRDKGKRPEMGKIAQHHADHIIITDDNPRTEDPDSIRRDILDACPQASNIGNRREAIQKAIASLESGDVLIVAGKGHENGQMIGNTTHIFHDPTVIQEILQTSSQKEMKTP